MLPSIGCSSYRMKTFATFSKPEEAHLFAMRLEAAGIPAFVQDEHLIQMYWLYSNTIGGVRVQIPDQELQAALEFLAADVPPENSDWQWVACPRCGSLKTAPDERRRRVSFVCLILFRFPLMIGKHVWQCGDCHQTFKAAPTREWEAIETEHA